MTVVGHSFGGGVAMQFAYQFPERTERMILVASGGLGPEVSPALRAVTTPGFHQLMGLLTLPGIRHLGRAGLIALSRTDLKATRDFDEVAEIYDSFKDPASRAAIRHVVKAVIDWRGQIVTMADRAYLTEQMPMAVIWGRDDRVIPVRHASNAAALAPNARIEVIPHAGHFPHKDHPQRFAKIVHEFIRSTQPATYSRARFRGLLKSGRRRRRARSPRCGTRLLDTPASFGPALASSTDAQLRCAGFAVASSATGPIARRARFARPLPLREAGQPQFAAFVTQTGWPAGSSSARRVSPGCGSAAVARPTSRSTSASMSSAARSRWNC